MIIVNWIFLLRHLPSLQECIITTSILQMGVVGCSNILIKYSFTCGMSILRFIELYNQTNLRWLRPTAISRRTTACGPSRAVRPAPVSRPGPTLTLSEDDSWVVRGVARPGWTGHSGASGAAGTGERRRGKEETDLVLRSHSGTLRVSRQPSTSQRSEIFSDEASQISEETGGTWRRGPASLSHMQR